MANKTVNMSLRITQDEKEKIMIYAMKNELTMSQAIRRAIKDFLNKQELNMEE